MQNTDAKAKIFELLHFMAWPFALSSAINICSGSLSQLLHIPRFTVPILGILVWVPFFVVLGYRQWREAERKAQQEKQFMQAKFDAEDAATCGGEFTHK